MTSKRTITFLRRLADARERLAKSIEGLDATVICQEPLIDDWTIKDILGHIVSWNEEFRLNIAMILQGKHPGFDHVISEEDNFSEWNHQWIIKKREYSLKQIQADVERDNQEAVALIENMAAEEYRMRGVTPWKAAAVKKPGELKKEDLDSVETLVTFHWRHMNEHIHQIEKWRQKRGSKDH